MNSPITIRGIAATFGTIVDPSFGRRYRLARSCFRFQSQHIPLLADHSRSQIFAHPLRCWADPQYGLLFEASIAPTLAGNWLADQIASGTRDQCSVTFRPRNSTTIRVGDKYLDDVTDGAAEEISIVAVGADSNTAVWRADFAYDMIKPEYRRHWLHWHSADRAYRAKQERQRAATAGTTNLGRPLVAASARPVTQPNRMAQEYRPPASLLARIDRILADRPR
jgi:phage head maturation protease